MLRLFMFPLPYFAYPKTIPNNSGDTILVYTSAIP
jgi:hypothetical protein